MNIKDILLNLISRTKIIDINFLPSRGYFYPNDFLLKIKKASIEDIIDYEYNFDSSDILKTLEVIKRVVKNNTSFNNNYKYEYIKSVDVIFIFLEIVKFTNNKEIGCEFYDETLNEKSFVNFDKLTFNYFNFDNVIKYYNRDSSEFIIDGYKFSLPSIGSENSLTNYLMSKNNEDSDKWLNYSYNFLYFNGNKTNLSFDEIENLIIIYNNELSSEDTKNINDIVDIFKGIINYSLKKDGKVIEMKSRLNLAKIWE